MKMSKQSVPVKKVGNKKDGSADGSGPHIALEEGDVKVMIEYLLCMQDENPNFFCAIDLNQEQQMFSGLMLMGGLIMMLLVMWYLLTLHTLRMDPNSQLCLLLV